jgi:uncharacterized protein (UPF0297 family)
MDSLDKTMYFQFQEGLRLEIQDILGQVFLALEEKGYNPINQIGGYLLSGDPAYIPRHKDARRLIQSVERDEIIEELTRSYLEQYQGGL